MSWPAQELLPAPAAPAPATPIAVDWAALHQDLQLLHGELERSEISCAQRYKNMRPVLEAVSSEATHTLGQQIDALEFEEALDTLKAIQNNTIRRQKNDQ